VSTPRSARARFQIGSQFIAGFALLLRLAQRAATATHDQDYARQGRNACFEIANSEGARQHDRSHIQHLNRAMERHAMMLI